MGREKKVDFNNPEHHAMLLAACDLVLRKGMSPSKARQELVDAYGPALAPISSQKVLPLIQDAFRAGFIMITPPMSTALESKIGAIVGERAADIRVVASDANSPRAVAYATANRVIEILRSIRSRAPARVPVLGLGSGHATLHFCEALSRLLECNPELAPVRLIAISAGSHASSPEIASNALFNVFRAHVSTRPVGFFGPPAARRREFERIKKLPGAREAFKMKDMKDIDVVITSMGDPEDEHDSLLGYLDLERRPDRWVGNVQYRPYDQDGPILEKADDLRAVTLFELDDLREMAQTKHKHVLLMAQRCPACGSGKGRSLVPLIKSPDLKVWSEIFVDVQSATELVHHLS